MTPTKAQRPCRKVGCVELTRDTYCEQHKFAKRSTFGERKHERDRMYSTVRWQRLRRRVLSQSPVCEADGCSRLSQHVDHIISVRKGGARWARSNLQALCASCHSSKTLSELHSASDTTSAQRDEQAD